MKDSSSTRVALEERLTLYRKRIQVAEAEVERLSARSRLVSNLRGLSFGVAVVATLLDGSPMRHPAITDPSLSAPASS